MDSKAASEIVGTILLTGIAVVFAAGFVLLLFSVQPPTDVSHPNVEAFVLPTSPTSLVLEHRGGPSIPLSKLTALVTVNGTTTSYVVGNSLGSGWTVTSAAGVARTSTDRFASGDQAVFTSATLAKASVSVAVADAGKNALALTPATILATDTTAPTLASARTTSTTTIQANFTEALSAIAASDFTVTSPARTISTIKLLGNGSAAEITVTSALATSDTPAVSAIASPAGTRDVAGNVLAGGASVTAADGVAPAITVGPAASVTTTSATVTWTTGEAGTSVVDFGPTTAYGRTFSDATSVTSHSAALTTLTPGTLYYYRVSSADAAGNVVTSSQATFTTTSAGGGGGGDAFLGVAQTWTALQTFGTQASLDATDITSGTLADARLASNVSRIDQAKTWTAVQTFGASPAISSGFGLLLTPTATGSLPSCVQGLLVYDATADTLKVGRDSCSYTALASTGTANTWNATQTFNASTFVLQNKVINQPILSGTSTTITLPVAEPNASYGVVCTPNFSTSGNIVVTTKTTTSFTITYPNQASATGKTVDCMLFR